MAISSTESEKTKTQKTSLQKRRWIYDWLCPQGESFKVEIAISHVTARPPASAKRSLRILMRELIVSASEMHRGISREPCRTPVSEKRQ